ncbi:hypothetical protein [Thermomonospora cellulosilytica]|uniref:Uncharacterized protein n=1 Tax=Thermomonospora cellulosilytica TaxID=1411118 RepID=A0A7W3MUD4_9ACTN|nr:hypothetical protein [Thermomonospora cellulosilytica]MBA9002028.1 hypothetical protein [Thermomonospora cellulosilytica]
MADTTPTDPTDPTGQPDQHAAEMTVDLAFRMGLALGRIEAKIDALLLQTQRAAEPRRDDTG